MTTDTSSEFEFSPPQEVEEKFPELTDLLMASQALDNEEKKFWFDSLLTMEESHIESLYKILDDERQFFEMIETEEYKQKQKEFERQEKMKAVKAKEEQSKQEDAEQKESLLSLLDDL
jgi:hypothetical protein